MTTAQNDPRIQRGMEAMLKLRQSRLDAGEKPIGWKVGFGSQAAMEKFGLDGPLICFLTDSVVMESGSTVSVSGWVKGAAEAEVAVYMGKDLPAGADEATARDAIASVGPAIELADVTFAPEDIVEILADNMYNRHVLFGKPDPSRAGCDLDGLVAHIYRDGTETVTITDLQAMTGNYVDITRHVATVLAAFGETLRAGEVIIMGAITPHLWLDHDEDIEYHLAPGDKITLTVKA